WIGYTRFSKAQAKKRLCLASELRKKRIQWMQQMLARDMRMPDVSIISTLERNITFFASSSMLIIAGLLTAMSSAEQIQQIMNQFTFVSPQTIQQIQIKLLVIIGIFVYAFFQFTWALRQYGFGGVLIGAAPEEGTLSLEQHVLFANRAAKVIDQAAHSFNYGLRAIYLSMAALTWFIDPRAFMFATVVAVIIMYHREFHSKALRALRDCA
ncbi:MAG: DUF599 domain-containing protein, partial [Glaciecola sp.]